MSEDAIKWDIVTRAAALSAAAHDGQLRDDGSPYAQHPARVAVLLAWAGGDEALIAAGFLHDTIEDCDVDYDDILEACGEDAADRVAEMSKDMRLREDIREPAYKQQLIDGSWRGRAVKLADQIDNWSQGSQCDPSTRDKRREKAVWALEIAQQDTDPVSVRLSDQLRQLLA